MKKNLTLLLLLGFASLHAQDPNYYKHNIDIEAGGGLQSIQFNPEEGDQKPRFGAILDVMYRYQFNEHWGIGAGIGFGFYNAKSSYENLQIVNENLIHAENDAEYDYRSTFRDWDEAQRMIEFELPVGAYFLTPMKKEEWSFLGSMGMKLNVPLWNKYKITEGTLQKTGYFEELTNIEYANLPQHGFGTETEFSGKADLKSVGASAYVDAGFLRHLKENKALYLGVYFAYRFTNLAVESDQALYNAETDNYVGVVSSNFVDKAHAISAGIKIGLSIGLPNDYRIDSDKDGVFDRYDLCPDTPEGVQVDSVGCPFDSDKDGVLDYLDKCPDTPEGVQVDSVGCPVDTDLDGIPDYLDKCPDTPEGVQVDSVGCPLDSDMDGVADYLDKCPNTPAGVQVDSVGCPVDTDLDGIPDYLDKCPTIYGVPSENGCPKIEQKVQEIIKKAIKGIVFETGKSTIKPVSFKILNQVVDIMKENPDYLLSITGHTDNVGKPDKNLKLSIDRAAAVKQYLINKGVEMSRLTSDGKGDTMPIDDNSTAKGRQNNRRVDFEIEYKR